MIGVLPIHPGAGHAVDMPGAPTVDPVTAEVIRGAMETVAYEMATHVSLTATTPILNQSNERNATVLDDVLDELVSIEGARRDYGVALRGTVAGDDLAIDWAETERLRKGRLAPS